MSNYSILFPNHPDPDPIYLPMRFQHLVEQHRWWYEGARIGWSGKNDCYILSLVNGDDLLPLEWDERLRAIGGVMVKMKVAAGETDG